METNLNQSVTRALTILDAVGDSKEKLGVREIARRVGFATTICQRMINTLTVAGYLEQCQETKKYSIGYKAFVAGSKYLSRNDILSASVPELQVLAREHCLNAYLGVLRGKRAVHLATIQSESPIVIRGLAGESVPLHTTALGKSLLIDHTDAEVDDELGEPPYQKLTKKTLVTRKNFLADLRMSRDRKYCVSAGENLADVLTIGAPVRDMSGHIVAAISGAIYRGDVPVELVQSYGKVIVEAARRISMRLGFRDEARR